MIIDEYDCDADQGRGGWVEVERPREMFANELRRANETVRRLQDELARLRARLAEHERTQATGGPPPPETRGWANEAIVPAPETAHDQSMAVPDRYQRSDAHLRDRREDTT